jgi:hypothetical protein
MLPFLKSTYFRVRAATTENEEKITKAMFTESQLPVMSFKKPQNVGKMINPMLYEIVTSDNVTKYQRKRC